MNKILIIIITEVTFLFGGCMAFSMLGGGGHNEHSTSSSTTVHKEVTSNGVKAEATFPPLVRDKETTLTLKLTVEGTGKPLQNVGVWFHATYTHQPMERHSGLMDHSLDHSRMEDQRNINYDAQLTDTTNSGKFSVPFTPTQSGEYVMAFHIVQGEEKAEENITVEQKLNVEEESHASSGMMGSFGPYAIITGAVMGAVMIYVWLSGSTMF